MNFVYSILKRYFSEVKSDRFTYKVVFTSLLAIIIIVPLGYISFLKKHLNFEIGTLPVYLGFPIFSFLPLVALVYAFYPGYKYLSSVQNYSTFKVKALFWLIILTPTAGILLLSKFY